MLKKKKTTASGKLVLVKSVRRHWTSGGCSFSADRSGTETAQPQNEILCSKGLGGAALNKQAERKITEGFCALRNELPLEFLELFHSIQKFYNILRRLPGIQQAKRN